MSARRCSARAPLCVPVCGCVFDALCAWVRVSVGACMRGCLYAWVPVCVGACMRGCLYAWVPVCVGLGCVGVWVRARMWVPVNVAWSRIRLRTNSREIGFGMESIAPRGLFFYLLIDANHGISSSTNTPCFLVSIPKFHLSFIILSCPSNLSLNLFLNYS